LLHLVGDLFELYDDARTYKPSILWNSWGLVPVQTCIQA